MTQAVDQRASSQPPLIVFIHVPRTAGTMMRLVLARNEPGDRTRRVANVFRGGGGTKRGVTFESLRDPDGARLRHVRVVTGHAPLGIREYLRNGRQLRCFTFLREPIDRSLSHYFAIRENTDDRRRLKHRSLGLAPLPPEPTLEDMLKLGYLHDNLHTRMLSGLLEPFGEVNEAMLEQAMRNLREDLVFFGLTERFDESVALAQKRLGLPNIVYRSRRHVSSTRPRGDQVPPELVRAAERCNRYDIELYRYAGTLFDAQ